MGGGGRGLHASRVRSHASSPLLIASSAGCRLLNVRDSVSSATRGLRVPANGAALAYISCSARARVHPTPRRVQQRISCVCFVQARPSTPQDALAKRAAAHKAPLALAFYFRRRAGVTALPRQPTTAHTRVVPLLGPRAPRRGHKKACRRFMRAMEGAARPAVTASSYCIFFFAAAGERQTADARAPASERGSLRCRCIIRGPLGCGHGGWRPSFSVRTPSPPIHCCCLMRTSVYKAFELRSARERTARAHICLRGLAIS